MMNCNSRNSGSIRGFTLVEVMVALAIVAIALPALMFTLYQQVDGTAYLRDKSQAQLVAANKLTEIRILAKANGSLLSGRENGQAQMADRQWYWWVESTATEVPEFYRVAISVGLEEEQPDQTLHTLVAYLSADLRTDDAGDAGG
jgi:general secretion pathway protein I